jgi:putative transposase
MQDLHSGHHSIRLPNFDYSSCGLYFLTICSHERRNIFARIEQNEPQLKPLGILVRDCWFAIPFHFPATALHQFVVMPNHLHGIIEFREWNNARLGTLVRSFKAAVTQRAHLELRWQGPVWQRNYFERVIRDAKEYDDAVRYITDNPLQWTLDRENLD